MLLNNVRRSELDFTIQEMYDEAGAESDREINIANFDEEISKESFKSVDVTSDVKEGSLQEKISDLFGE